MISCGEINPLLINFSEKDQKENEMKRRLKAENGTAINSTSVDSNNTMAGPFMLNGSQPEFPMGPPPPFPPSVEGENSTGDGAQPPPQQPLMAPPQQFVDENGTVHHFAPRPFFPFGMYPPQTQHNSENGSAPMMYPPFPYPYPYPPIFPQANPFIRNKMPQPEVEPQVNTKKIPD